MAKKAILWQREHSTALKGAERVRASARALFLASRWALTAAQHSVFEILSNAIDEAREGYGNRIIVTKL